MNALKLLFVFAFCFSSTWLSAGSMTDVGHESEANTLPVFQDWQGDYPVARIDRLPEGQRSLRVGYFDNLVRFTKVWQAFKPGEELPVLDFSRYIVVFSRNVTFYNRTAILKVLLRDGVVEILTIETRSALPIEDKVGMAIAVIPRVGVKYIKAGNGRIPVTEVEQGFVSGPLNTTYTIEGNKIILQNGCSEMALGSDSATKIRTCVSGDVIEGDLDGDGDKDAALILVHDPGGSGTFYYVAVAENRNGRYRGTNAVRLGDRIAPKDLRIRNGVVIVKYARRRLHEPMSMAPTVEAFLYLAFKDGKLKALKPLGTDEQILEGRVIVGHEVRSFHPCTRKTDYWLSGDSPALGEIMARYNEALSDARPYTPLFMVLAGKFVEVPREGYGADYDGSFFATQVVGVRPEGNCKGRNNL